MIALLFLLLSLLIPTHAFAIYDPLSVTNNTYGIHVADTNDIHDTAALINSSGGDWGYVTIVIEDHDRNTGKWQGIFNLMRRLHLIPIVRLATHLDRDAWAKPTKESAPGWVQFLDSLNWPVVNRYIVLFNEPNHAKEWGGSVNPEEYADTVLTFPQALKSVSQDFFVLPAGLDASAATDGESLDETAFLRRLIQSQPTFFDAIDGWTSHSYPNPGFSGSPFALGRGTLRTYLWELALANELGNTKSLPVFITETGWLHGEGKIVSPKLLSSEAVASNFTIATSMWSDPRIAAVTPFVFNYQDIPFDHFSWRKLGTSEFYPQFYSYQSIPKVKGKPRQRLVFIPSHPLFPPSLVADSRYNLTTELKNEGSGILDNNDFELSVEATPKRGFDIQSEPLPSLEPGESGTLSIHIQTPKKPGSYELITSLKHFDERIPLGTRTVSIVPPPSIVISAQLGFRKTSTADDVSVLIYDGGSLIHRLTSLWLKDGQVNVEGLTGIIPGNSYRVVVLVPYYLPRQVVLPLSAQTTYVSLKRFLPFDLNRDGALTASDFLDMLQLAPKIFFDRLVGP
ncbi:hypothetical protein HY967_02500 [Candidatus Jorgensenbacteria bacterium]|nr:hypothetical protein [Candidatus Jorgensenbacteria bacterium]